MRILFWVPYPTEGASNRLRIEQYCPYLEKFDIKFSIRAFWSKSAFSVLYKKRHLFKKLLFFILGTLFRVFDILQILHRYDIIFIHRESHPIFGTLFDAILSASGKPIIFDFDDAIFLPASSRTNIFAKKFKNPEKIINIIKISKHIIAGNNYLADFALKYNRAVTVIPTVIDTQTYYPDLNFKNRQLDKVVIGWMGSATTIDFVALLENVFIELSKKYKNIEFKIVGGEFFIPSLSNVRAKPWSLREEIDDLRDFDIGIMPMPDNEWTKGKCGFKAILYMSLGIPTVCSPVGINKDIVTEGVNGLLADKEDEWIKKLSILIESAELRRKIGLAGRKTVEEKYSLIANAPKFLAVINKVYNDNKFK